MAALLGGRKVVSLIVENGSEVTKRGIARIPHWEYHIRYFHIRNVHIYSMKEQLNGYFRFFFSIIDLGLKPIFDELS